MSTAVVDMTSIDARSNNTIFIINPNSSTEVTAAIDRAVEPQRSYWKGGVEVLRLASGPAGIETQAHIDQVIQPLTDLAGDLDGRAAALVVACFSDPALQILKQRCRAPVLGIAESSILLAMQLGQRFGVLSILPASVSRHLRYMDAMGVSSRLAADRALNLGVAELSDRERTLERLSSVARTLRDDDNADVLIMACAGLADYRSQLADIVGLPVVEPTQAALALAIGRASLGR